MGDKPKAKWQRRREYQSEFDVLAAMQRIQGERVADCWVGNCSRVMANPAHVPCCSSHNKPMCCEHYKQLHFVETGATPCHTASGQWSA